MAGETPWWDPVDQAWAEDLELPRRSLGRGWLDVAMVNNTERPEPLAGAGNWVDVAFDAIDGGGQAPFFDPPRSDVWIPEGEPLPTGEEPTATSENEEQTNG